MTSRRCMLKATLLAALTPIHALAADDYPSRPIRIIVPSPPGSGIESFVRRLADELRKRLGQPVIIENKPGGNTQIALNATAKAAPDGYTLGIGVVTNMALAPHTYRMIAYDPLKDLIPVALLAKNYLALVSRPDAGYEDVAGLVRSAGRAPRGVTVGATSLGGLPHMAFEQLARMTGMPFLMVSYSGNQQIVQDLIGGRLDVAMIDYSSAGQLVEAGKLRLLGISSPERDPRLPHLPTIAETVKGFQSMGWIGIVAPTGVPIVIVERLNTEFNIALKHPQVEESLVTLGLQAAAGSTREFAEHIASEHRKFGRLATEIGFKPQ